MDDDADHLIPQPPWLEPRPVRRARRQAGSPLSRDALVAAALALADEEGLDAVTARRLAERLGVTMMAMYWHVRDKAQLLDLVGEALLAEVELPPRSGDWRADLRALLHAARAALRQHPNAAVLAFGRARYGPSGLALFERLLEILADAGFDDHDAALAYMALYTVLRGNWSSEASARLDGAALAAYRDYLASLPPDRYPRTTAIGPSLFRSDPDLFFDFALDTMIAGLAPGAR
jgi:TetR/AcrR family tetracycline transcriptional repressor